MKSKLTIFDPETAANLGVRDGSVFPLPPCQLAYGELVATEELVNEPATRVLDLDARKTAGIPETSFEHVGYIQQALPDTFTVSTGRGAHVYFQWPKFYVRNSSGSLAPQVDVRGDGGYVVAPGSLHKGGRIYQACGSPDEVADAPAWLLAWPGLRLQTSAGPGKEAGDNAPIPVDVNTERGQKSLKAAQTWLAEEEPCISGDGGQRMIWGVANQLMRHYLLPIDAAFDLLNEDYNGRCVPPWSGAELMHTLENARDNGTLAPGGVDVEGFTPGLRGANDTAPMKEPTFLFERGDHAELSEELIRCNPTQLTTTEGAIWEYKPKTGAWTSHQVEPALRNDVLGYAGRAKKGKEPGKRYQVRINHNDVEGVIKSVRTRTFNEEFFVVGRAGISCTNGLVTMNGLLPHSPENRSRSAYPFAFDPYATAPLFQRFLLDLFRDDEDRDDKIKCLQEFFGGALFGLSTRFDKCIIAKGDGSNGKSTLLEIVRALFPAHQVQAIPPEKWGHSFTLAELVGCLLNIVADISATSLMDSPRFKDVVAGDLVQAERKHQPSFNFRPIAGHILALNPALETKDQTSGFWRRIIAIEFNRSFENDATKDTTISAKILETERGGVLAWLVAGARRLDAQDGYTVPTSHTKALAQWKTSSDNVRQFAEEFVDGSAKDESRANLGASRVYRTYKLWAQDNGHRPVTSKTFKSRLERVDGVTYSRISDGRVYRFKLAAGKVLCQDLPTP
jgi:P4 family phage/plasmid primase-like protien